MTHLGIVPSPLRSVDDRPPFVAEVHERVVPLAYYPDRGEERAQLADTEARKSRYRAAAHLATKVYAPPIARLIKAEFDAWIEWGWRLGPLPVEEELYAQVMRDAAEKGLA